METISTTISSYLTKLIFLIASMLFICGCANIMNSKYQKIKINSPNTNFSIEVDNKVVELKGNAISLPRDLKVHKMQIKKDGYKTKTEYLGQNKYSFFYFGNYFLIPFAYFPCAIGMIIDAKGTKYADYMRSINIDNLLPIRLKESSEKYLQLKNCKIGNDFKFLHIPKKSYWREKSKLKDKGEIYNFYNSDIKQSLNQILKKYGYSDTINPIFKSPNFYSLDCCVNKVLLQQAKFIQSAYGDVNPVGSLKIFRAKTNITWSLFNTDGSKVDTFAINNIFSDNFVDSYSYSDAFINSIENSFLKLVSDTLFIRQINKKPKITYYKTPIGINSDTTPSASLEDLKNKFTIVNYKDNKTIGMVISNNGLVMALYSDSSISLPYVNTYSEKKVKANIKRYNNELYISLLEITDSVKLNSIIYNDSIEYEIGTEVYYVSTTDGSLKGIFLNEGIISGIREINGTPLIQTDASTINFDYGGFLIDKKGRFLGVINSKIIGNSIEGLSFFIPSKYIYKRLNLYSK